MKKTAANNLTGFGVGRLLFLDCLTKILLKVIWKKIVYVVGEKFIRNSADSQV